MTQSEVTEFSICFSAYLSNTIQASNTDAAECANMATAMVKHLINKFPKIREEMFFAGDGELLEELGITRKKLSK